MNPIPPSMTPERRAEIEADLKEFHEYCQLSPSEQMETRFAHVHEYVAKRHPALWFLCNSHIAGEIQPLGLDMRDARIRYLVSLAVVRTLDCCRATEHLTAIDAATEHIAVLERERSAFDWWLSMFWMKIVQDASSLYFVDDPSNYKSSHFVTRKEAVLAAFDHFNRAAQTKGG